jgi:hypothetical protein
MMIRYVLLLLLIVFVARAFWRMVDGMLEGLSGRRRGAGSPQRGVQMVRDPVCGTFILPEKAVALVDGSRRMFFCSTVCRDKYRAGTA